nr:beta-propeller domain-containing protein [Actinomycetota bacterium]
RAFRSCDALLGHARTQALKIADPSGLPVRPQPGVAFPAADSGARGEGAPAATPTSDAVPSHSTTNVQEAGVDEPDLVKTDGRFVFALAGGALRVVDVRGAEPKVVATLRLDGFAQEMLLSGGRLLVFSQPAYGTGIAEGGVGSTLTEVDVRDPANPAIVRTLELEGNYVSARLNGTTARVVIGSYPRPIPLAGGEGTELRRRRAAIRRTRLKTWVPRYRLTNARTKRSVRRSLVSCRATRRPAVFSGLGMLTLLTIDLSKGITPVDSDGLMTDARTVYGSPTSLYVASERWVDPGGDVPLPGGRGTTVHRFDARDSDHTTFRASGSVRGYLLNQFALSEHDGVLRVATTEAPLWWSGPDTRERSESFVTVLGESGGVLRTLGQVGGLGRGERIYAVRFIEDQGYVVTFRQVDPLYVLALADPSAPRVVGELKILGYSAYLHPIAGDLLIGVGQDATEEGRTRGIQVSLFDVSKPSAPARLDAAALGQGSSSEAEFDHHAFLWWAPSSLAVIPLRTYDTERETFMGAAGFRVDRAKGVDEAGRVSHEPRSPIRRSLVVGDRLFTVSDAGIKASRIDTLGDVAFAPF